MVDYTMNDYIDLYDYNKKLIQDEKLVYLILIFIMVFSIILFYIFIFVNIDDYYINNCAVNEDLLVCSVKYDELKYVINNDELYIDNEKYNYKVYSIDDEVVKMNSSYYRNINLEINLKDKNIDNNILQIMIKIYHKNLFNYLKDVIIDGKN